MCHARDNVSMEPWTNSDREGHGLCCRPDSLDEFCVTGDDLVCSESTIDDNPNSSPYKDILSPS